MPEPLITTTAMDETWRVEARCEHLPALRDSQGEYPAEPVTVDATYAEDSVFVSVRCYLTAKHTGVKLQTQRGYSLGDVPDFVFQSLSALPPVLRTWVDENDPWTRDGDGRATGRRDGAR